MFCLLDTIFSGVSTTSSSLTLEGFCLSMAAALILGAALALVYTYKSVYTRSFAVTLAMLPAIVSVVIMMVNGSIGTGVAVAGTFSLVRFRSVPGTAKEIGAIFLAMAVGIACGMGYVGFAALFAVIMCAVSFLYAKLGFGEKQNAALHKKLRVTVPEDLDYGGIFDDLFAKFTSEARLVKIKTTNLGSLNKLIYEIVLKEPGMEKNLIDELRCRNGNLEISCSVQGTDSQEL